MLQFIHYYSRRRIIWLAIFLTTIIFEIVSLWLYKYVMTEFSSCILCAYERCALLGITIASIIGIIAPNTILRYIALAIWLYSAGDGLKIAWQQAITQSQLSPIVICNFIVHLPKCSLIDKSLSHILTIFDNHLTFQYWKILTSKLSQWLVIIFTVYFIIAILTLIAQFYKPKQNNLFRLLE